MAEASFLLTFQVLEVLTSRVCQFGPFVYIHTHAGKLHPYLLACLSPFTPSISCLYSMNPNEESNNNSEDFQDMPDLVDWETQLVDATAQDSQQAPSTNVPYVATLPASGGE